MSDIWQEFGFKSNPYNPMPLKLTEEDARLFVGREKEAREFETIISSMKGGAMIVEGRIGVGKTSFVNIQEYRIWKGRAKTPRLLPTFETILLTEETDAVTFMLSSLSNALYALMKIHGEKKIKRNPVFKEALTMISQTLQTSFGLQAAAAGFGGGITKSVTITSPLATVMPTILSMTDGFVSELRRSGYEGVIIRVNNIDTLNERVVIEFLSQIRDIALVRPGLIWVLMGSEGLFSSIEKNMRRVSEIITGTPVLIKPLSKEDVKLAIQKRIENLRIREEVNPLIDDAIIDILYDISNGEIRYIFKRATDMILQCSIQFPTERFISRNMGLGILKDLAAKKMEPFNSTDREKEVLSMMSKKGWFRIRDYESFDMKTRQAANKYIQKFLDMGLIVKEQWKNETRYRTTGDVNILFGGCKPEK
ncbi:MAG: hypothetical protein CVT48_06285 [Thermoplasmata archaeon HGW-Thermoplasmata-1]|nr:MAG: hypothetical protein CVT48_06285 [Thermoplasmata archaeon HGW-Thermoplasmata-1]